MGGKWVPHEEDEFYSKLQIASDYVVFKTHDPWKSSNSIWDQIYEMVHIYMFERNLNMLRFLVMI